MNTSAHSPRVAHDLIWRLLDDNAVLVSPAAGEVRVLNHVGALIWQLLVDDVEPGEIEDHLVTHFDVSRDRVQEDMGKFFGDLTERGVLVWETAAY